MAADVLYVVVVVIGAVEGHVVGVVVVIVVAASVDAAHVVYSRVRAIAGNHGGTRWTDAAERRGADSTGGEEGVSELLQHKQVMKPLHREECRRFIDAKGSK